MHIQHFCGSAISTLGYAVHDGEGGSNGTSFSTILDVLGRSRP